ncbi:MAG TPA: hypothetical protein VFF26_00915 [Gallionella sp.]|nr:hypothetical protein [Gallionella sp.]
MKNLINILVAAIMLIAVLSAIWAGIRTENYWGIPIVGGAALLYWFLEWPSRQNPTISVLQHGITRILAALVVGGLGMFSVWLGVAEISAPVTFAFNSSNLIANLIRDTIGSVWISLILWWAGGALMVSGFRLIKPLSLRSSSTRDTP